eukprot:TRINITY_DN894_c0_g2_i1.p1 TRINITY_DN894_c0_g2~~TRINITY_DN894_c0_g2_i1.p1  ORF type:complete len:295 (-),score=29.37 TRINITY_DN894_c0_g2_i1:72-956(-)
MVASGTHLQLHYLLLKLERLLKSFSLLRNIFSRNQMKSGGLPYGLDFEYAPDTDDTALAVSFMCKIGLKNSETVKRALSWLSSMQNSNGGFAAFDRNREGNWILRYFTSLFTDSAEAFDPSCVDLTGHILETFGMCGITLENDKSGVLKKAVNYIKGQQTKFGAWEARWGLNYIYGVGAALPGLRRVGVHMQEKWIAESVSWLLSCQNKDGGFGESTKSYIDEKYAGKGVSTPSQTAWALLALLEVRHHYVTEDAIQKAVQYLLNDFRKRGTWFDSSSVGTGHRKILYLSLIHI